MKSFEEYIIYRVGKTDRDKTPYLLINKDTLNSEYNIKFDRSANEWRLVGDTRWSLQPEKGNARDNDGNIIYVVPIKIENVNSDAREVYDKYKQIHNIIDEL